MGIIMVDLIHFVNLIYFFYENVQDGL